MDHPQRLIFLILAIGWTLFRLLRYVRAGTSGRPGPAVPPSAGQQPAGVGAAPGAVPSPIEPSGGSALSGKLAAAGVLIAGNVVIWPLLFATPVLEEVPTMLRLIAGVLANLILIGLAGGVATRLTQRTGTRARDDRDPIK